MSALPERDTMIYIYYGDDRMKAQAAIRKIFGETYDVFDGEDYGISEVQNIFYGKSLFGEKKTVVRNLLTNKKIVEVFEQFLDTPFDIVLWEEKLDKRTTVYKSIVNDKRVEIREFKTAEPANKNLVFDIYNTALRDGAKAVKMLSEIEEDQDPYMFFGLLVSQAIKKYEQRSGAKEKRVLLELSKLDMQMKGDSGISSPWSLLKSFLLQVSSL